MRIAALFAVSVVVSAVGTIASACSPVMDERSISEIRRLSKPVAVDRQCRTINAGAYDDLSLGPATDLGNGRIQQVLDDTDKSEVLLADCNTREIDILRGPVIKSDETSCGPINTYAPLVGKHAAISLASGADLGELVDLASKRGVTEINPLDHFFTFNKWWESERHPVGKQDQFDLLCGCKIFYEESAGAKS